MSVNGYALSPPSGGVDYSLYKTPFTSDSALASTTSYQTALDITGSGFLNYFVAANSTAANGVDIKITVDGTVVHEARNTAGTKAGLVHQGSLIVEGAIYYIMVPNSSSGLSAAKVGDYPYIGTAVGNVFISQPLFFKNRLLVEFKAQSGATNVTFNWMGMRS